MEKYIRIVPIAVSHPSLEIPNILSKATTYIRTYVRVFSYCLQIVSNYIHTYVRIFSYCLQIVSFYVLQFDEIGFKIMFVLFLWRVFCRCIYNYTCR